MSDVNLSISKELVLPIIEAKVNAAVCEALSGHQSVVSDVVTKILNMKVDSNGRASTYSSDVPFIQWLCTQAIQDAAKQAVKNYISGSNEKLVQAVETVLQKNTKVVAVNLINSLIKTVEKDWRMLVSLSVLPIEK